MIAKKYHLPLIILLSVLIRLPLLFQAPWYDELFTYHVANLPLPSLLLATASDCHPPLYYLLAHYSVQLLGSTIWAVRIPALLFGVLAVFISFKVFQLLSLPYPYQLIAVLLMATLPTAVYYSVEARMYSVLMVAVLLSVWASYKNKPLGVGFGFAVGMLAHSLMMLYIPFILIIWLKNRPPLKNFITACSLFVVLYAPWLPVAYKQATRLNEEYWILPPTVGRVISALSDLLTHNTPLFLIYHAPLIMLLFLAIGGAVAISKKWLNVLLMAFGPLLLAVVISLIFQPLFIPRILIGSLPFVVYLLCVACHFLANNLNKNTRLLSVAPFVAVIAILSLNLFVSPLRIDLSEPYYMANVQKGDICYHLEPGTLIMSQYYHPACNHFIWHTDNRGADSLSNETLHALGHTLQPNIDNLLLVSGRAWLFHSTSPTTPSIEYVELERILSSYQTSQVLHQENILTSRTIWRIERKLAHETE